MTKRKKKNNAIHSVCLSKFVLIENILNHNHHSFNNNNNCIEKDNDGNY